MNKKLLLIVAIFIIIFGGCNTNNRENYIRNVIGSELKIDADSMLTRNNVESYSGEMGKQLKIVVYSDSSNCNACDIRFPVWKIRYKELSLKNSNIGLIFIINTENINDMELNANVVNAPGLRLYDTQGIFKRNNNIFNQREFHVFLLDKDNKVILVGNPLDNNNLYTLYKDAIEMFSNNDNK